MRLDTLALLLMLVAGFCVARASAAPQAGQVPRIRVLIAVSAPTTKLFYDLFRQGLGALGYVEAQHIALEYRSAEGQYERLPALAAELVGLPVDVLVTWGTPAALAAKHATSTLPIIFTAVADPILSGLVRGFAQPGGNITGVTLLADEVIPAGGYRGVVGAIRPNTALHLTAYSLRFTALRSSFRQQVSLGIMPLDRGIVCHRR